MVRFPNSNSQVWDMDPDEIEEHKSLAAGGYVGVRRVVRLLEVGEQPRGCRMPMHFFASLHRHCVQCP